MSSLHYNIDSVLVKDKLAFGFGWVFSEEQSIKNIELNLLLNDKTIITQYVDFGKHRADVAAAFPESSHSLKSGFLFYSAWTGNPLEAIYLTITLHNNHQQQIDIFRQSPENGYLLGNEVDPRSYLIKKAFSYAKQGKLRALWKKAISYHKRRPRKQGAFSYELCNTIINTRPCKSILIIDHNLGGGANEYRDQLVKQLVSQGKNILILGYDVPTLQYFLSPQVNGTVSDRKYSIRDLDCIFSLLNKGLISEVMFNNSVSFEKPEIIPGLLFSISHHYSIPVTIFIHDFLTICPSHFLIDNHGKYCQVPSTEVCEVCLQKNKETFVGLFVSRSIAEWRSHWKRCLENADKIVCFSKSSRNILLHTYPTIDNSRITLSPHKIDYMGPEKLVNQSLNSIHIGVVGQIGRHKGAAIISDLSFFIAKHRLPIKITVIGILEAEYDKRVLTETGNYAKGDLTKIILASGINIFLFPSIWPETFSFVTEELVTMDAPIICFDFGAPAERIKKHELGKVIPFTRNPKSLIDEIEQLFKEIKMQRASKGKYSE